MAADAVGRRCNMAGTQWLESDAPTSGWLHAVRVAPWNVDITIWNCSVHVHTCTIGFSHSFLLKLAAGYVIYIKSSNAYPIAGMSTPSSSTSI